MSLLLDVTVEAELLEPEAWSPRASPGSIELVGEAKKSVEKRARLVELRVEADRALDAARFAFLRLTADRSECLVALDRRRRRITDALAARLAAIVAPVRLLTTADLREMGVIA